MIKITNSLESGYLQSVTVHGSKYIANRLLFICSLAEGKSILKNVPSNRDIEISIEVLRELGVEIKRENDDLVIGGNLLNQNNHSKKTDDIVKIYTHESGTFSRFILPLLSLLKKDFYVYGSDRMNQRPMHDLINCLCSMQVKINCQREGFLPLSLNGKDFKGGRTEMKGNVSSQYFSALLLVAPYVEGGIDLNIIGNLISKKYLDMTTDLMKKFEIKFFRKEYQQFKVEGGQRYQSKNYSIEADTVASSYFMALSILKNQPIAIKDYNLDSIQGEAKFLDLIHRLFSVDFKKKGEKLFLYPKKSIKDLKGIDFGQVDMGDMPDVVQTLVVIIAAIENAKIEITNIGHLKYKESDRVKDTANELKKFGLKIEDYSDSLKIVGGIEKKENLKINCHNDHRMAMSLSLLSIPIGEVTLEGEECVTKSFPKYWEKLKEFNFEIKTL